MMKKKVWVLSLGLLASMGFANVLQLVIPMHLIKSDHDIGVVIARQTAHGILFCQTYMI
jgi:hypothetical protein